MEFKNVKEIINFLYKLADPSTKIIDENGDMTIDNFKAELEEALNQMSDKDKVKGEVGTVNPNLPKGTEVEVDDKGNATIK